MAKRLARLQDPNYQKPDSINILAIDCGMGDTPLQVKNVLKQAGITAQIYHLTTHPEFLVDIRPFAAGAVYADSKILAQAIQACFPEVAFDYILTDSELPISQITPVLLTAVKSRLTADGDFGLFIPSPYYYKQVKVDLTVNPQHYPQLELDLQKLIVTVHQYFKQGVLMPFQLNKITKAEVQQYLAPFFVNISDAEFNKFTTLRYCAMLQP